MTAFRFNPLLIALLPVLAWHGAVYVRRKMRNEEASFAIRPARLWLFLGVALAFSILRNLPGVPFATLPQ